MNNLPQKYENGVFNKILNFFRKIFSKKDKELQIEINKNVEQTNEVVVKITTDHSINEMKKSSKEKNLKEDILDIVTKNPDAIDKLSKDKLVKLNKMLDDKIDKNNKEIEQLKQKYEKLKSKVS